MLCSLPLELDMYLALPLLFFSARKNQSQWPLLGLWGLFALFGYAYLDPRANNILMVIPNFIPGVMAYVAFCKRRATLPAWLFTKPAQRSPVLVA